MAEAREHSTASRASQKAEQNLDNLNRVTGPLGENGEELAAKLRQSVNNIEGLTSELLTFSEAINSSEGSFGKLLRDDALYDDARKMIANLNEQVRNVKPIMENLKIATDKIATDPRLLGAKGALDRRPLGIGVKDSFHLINPNSNAADRR